MSAISERFKKLREVKSISQTEFAEKIGIKQSSLSSIEKGTTKPSIDTVIATSKVFGVSTDWILLGEGPKVSTAKEVHFLTLFGLLSEKDKEEILRILEIKLDMLR
ncbi:helix-turn-helix domain-containing protein [Mesobacillus subterraneus]|uniref:helix-turn-helix domain-containing protein n=1 Tax=Mesobacillus subterraneus TaxID=285983 RepID=UPI002040FEEF|nr:helix-turn-helix transcriptional regulator [Mesobacillus subterraneus]MCM3576434.1 helix-turn-helix domain-containing protein [Mesobacillus subterraneus]